MDKTGDDRSTDAQPSGEATPEPQQPANRLMRPDARFLRMRTELLDAEVEVSTLTKRIRRSGKGNLSELVDRLRKMAATAPPEEAEVLTISADVHAGKFEFDRGYRRRKGEAFKKREIERRVDDLMKQGYELADAVIQVKANSEYRSFKSIYNKVEKLGKPRKRKLRKR
jgi:methylphosphotriester-DNA--protein-cysteine methyltransferase